MADLSQITLPIRNKTTGVIEQKTFNFKSDAGFEDVTSLFHATSKETRLINSNDHAIFSESIKNFIFGIVVFKTNLEYFTRIFPTEMIPLNGSLKLCEMAYLPSSAGQVTMPLSYYASNIAYIFDSTITMGGCSYTNANFKIGVCDVYGCMRKANLSEEENE